MNIRYLSYHTIFTAITNPGPQQFIGFDHHHWVCFAPLFRMMAEIVPKTQYSIIMNTDKESLNQGFANYCSFSPQVICNHMKQAQRVVPELLSFSVIASEYKGHPCYELTFTIDQAEKLVHKYVLTWARFLYEAPFSIVLKDALRLAKEPKFRFVSVANLVNVVASCLRGQAGYPYYNTGHSIGCGESEQFLTAKELRARLSRRRSLNDLYSKRNLDITLLPEHENSGELEFWESDEVFQEVRYPVYVKTFNKMKEGYKYNH